MAKKWKYMKWFSSHKKGMKEIERHDKKYGNKSGATLFDGNVAGYKTGYVVVSKKNVKGWKEKKID